MGVACTNVIDRVLTAFGVLNNTSSSFKHCRDVSNAGVLIALPALVANGLYHKMEECFREFVGYYSIIHIITLIAFMALCRIKTVEELRYEAPGEMGKILGLDRIPEVRCLRNKLTTLSEQGNVEQWGEYLTKKWMNDSPELSGVLYVDGHVRLYDGKEKLPKLYVSRERLCLRGVMDYWVNDITGQPFFVVRTIVNPGMLEVLRNEIVPRLLLDVPNQPTDEMLESNPKLCRFIIVFDREGYSPKFFKEMWEKYRIACMTYHKYPKCDWDEKEFKEITVKMPNGESSLMKLAEKESRIGGKIQGLDVREIRKLTKSGHQTSVISTAYSLQKEEIAVLMFARWCQENFFNYMMQHFAIDLLSDYSKKDVPDTEEVILPRWRELEQEKKSTVSKLKTKRNRFASLTLHPTAETDREKYNEWEKIKIDLAEEISILEAKLEDLKKIQKGTNKYIKVKDLPDEEIFKSITSSKKQLVDTIRMIAYRAETAMANLILEKCGTLEQSRALLRDVFSSEADLVPDENKKTLTIRLHNLSTQAMDKKLDVLLSHLNKTEMVYPTTDLIMHFQRIGN